MWNGGEPNMRLEFSLDGHHASCDWASFALFRDNVQHFAEHGQVSEKYAALHGLEQAVVAGAHEVDAARLRGEVLGALFVLGGLKLEDAAISLRTRAILTGSTRLPQVRGTVRANQAGWELPTASSPAGRLLDPARPFLEAVMAVTRDAVDGHLVQVRREGSPPPFARDPSPPRISSPDQ
jgi:hypothetical protein